MNILIVEDDRDLNEGLCYSLKKAQYTTQGVFSVSSAKQFLNQYQYDVVVLDCNLPDGNGYELCQLVKNKYGIPCIFLTARDSEIDELKGFEMGACDYITKPFSLSILKARLNNVLHPTPNRIIYKSGDITLDSVQQLVKKREEILELTKIEFMLLHYLMENNGQILKKENILNYIWDNNGRYVDGNVVSVNIRRLRLKIEDNPSTPKYIISVRGIGYKWQGALTK